MRLATAILIVAVHAFPVAALADCPADLADLRAAAQSGSLQDIEAMTRKIGESERCEPREQRAADALLSAKLMAEAKRIDPSFHDRQASALIDEAAALEADWHASEIKGKLQRSANDFKGAAVSFEIAIYLITQDAAVPATEAINEATAAERANLATEADEARHLAAVESRAVRVKTRCDEMSRCGIGVRLPAPILFDFNSAKLNRLGIDAAQEVAHFLKHRPPKAITLTGHTDHVGSAAFNLDLSKRRVATVAAFLRDQGISIPIVTVGKGFSEPRKLSEGSNYTLPQIDQLNRRVEFDWQR